MDPWQQFEEVAQATLETGQKAMIPIVGSGFNLQAARDSSNWVALLMNIGRELGLSSRHIDLAKLTQMSATATWEYFITTVALIENKSASDVEASLKKIVKKQLNQFEKDHKDDEFYREFLDIDFRDIISLNFDRTPALHGKKKLVNASFAGNPEKFKNYKRHLITLFRHLQVFKPQTRIWYPHGDTGSHDTIKLGIREYGIYIKSIEEAVQLFIRTWIAFLEKEGCNFFREPELFTLDKYRHYWEQWSSEVREHEQVNWTWLFMASPIVFLGCGLSRDEWPLWWILHQRARIFARLPEEERTPVFVFWNAGEPANTAVTQWLAKRPADITMLPCDDWGSGWNRVLDTLKSRTPTGSNN